MMMMSANSQRMCYALQDTEIPVYERDENGDIIYYEDEDGNKIPLETGETELGYSAPTEFFANISNKLNEVRWSEFGIDNSANYAQIVASKNALPIKVGSAIWKKSEIGYKDEEKTLVDESTADYVVKGVADEGVNEDLFLLQRNVK